MEYVEYEANQHRTACQRNGALKCTCVPITDARHGDQAEDLPTDSFADCSQFCIHFFLNSVRLLYKEM